MTDKGMFKGMTYESLNKQVDGNHYSNMKIQPAEFINENNMKVIKTKFNNQINQRIAGFKIASSQYIMQLDSDVILDKIFLDLGPTKTRTPKS